jgi:HK97 family phage prohead protease
VNKKLDTKDLMEVKFAMDEGGEEKGIFTGYASVFGVLDSYGDIVDAGAFTKTLKNNNPVPMLWNHSVDEPIGVVHLKKDHTGLKAEGHLNLDVPRAQSVRSLMKQGAVKGLSIGYQTVKEDTDKELNARVLKEIKLWEVSPVVFQACPGALVSDVKSEVLNDGDTAISALPDAESAVTATPDEKPHQIVEPEFIHSNEAIAAAIKEVRESLFPRR